MAVFRSTINASAVVTPPVPPDADIVDDFDFDKDANYWNGVNGIMEEFGENKSITNSFVTADAHAGRSLMLTYNLNTSSSWNGYFLTLNNSVDVTKNISGYQQLSFWIKGSVGGVEHLKIGLENTSPAGRNSAYLYVADYLDGGITNAWQKVSIPLDAFANLDSRTNAKTLTFVFERAYADASGLSRTGTVFIDDVRFSSVSLGTVRIDHFGDNWGWGALGGNTGDGASGQNGVTASHSYTNAAGTYNIYPWAFQSNYSVPVVNSFSYNFVIIGGGANGWTAVPCNFSGYRYFKFWARAASAGANPGSFKIEIPSTGHTSPPLQIIITGLTTTYQQFVVDLNNTSVASKIDKTAILQINIVYENSRVTNKTGTVYFDDFEFSVNP